MPEELHKAIANKDRLLAVSVGLILLASICGKAVALFSSEHRDTLDAVLQIPTVWVYWLSAVFEGILLLVFVFSNRRTRACCIIGTGVQFTLYHIASAILGSKTYCPCFGAAWNVLGLSEQQMARVSFWLAGYILIAGLFMLVWATQERRLCAPEER